MSIVYKKSRSDEYGKYFASISDHTRNFSLYSLEKMKSVESEQFSRKPWEMGRSGIPLAWSQEEKTVRVDHTDNHTMVIGPTGSKKSRLVVMPQVRILSSTGESMIISDPKAEIYNRTGDYLAEKGYNIFVLNLRSPNHGNRWNPLSIPFDFYSRGEIDKAYEFVNDIAENLIQTDKSDKDPFWDNSAGSFFFGLAILLFKYCREHNLGKEYVHMGNVVRLRNELLSASRGAKNVALWNYAKTDSIITSALIGTVETANDTKGSILSVFDQKVRMFSIQPNLLSMLAETDFDLSIIGYKPTAVFLVVPDEKTGYHNLVSLFIKQSYEYLIFNAQSEAERDGFHVSALKNRVNYIMDEFSSLPTIRDFPAMVTAARSRNIRFTLVIQSKHQLIQRYGDEAETIMTNCNNWIFLTSRELQLLKELSELCGNTREENPKPVLSISELQRMDKEAGEALLLCERSKPCITRLADIDEYDCRKYRVPKAETRKQLVPPEITIELPHEPKQDFPDWMNQSSEKPITKPDIDIDKLLKSIDNKIAELEAEEKASKEQKGDQ